MFVVYKQNYNVCCLQRSIQCLLVHKDHYNFSSQRSIQCLLSSKINIVFVFKDQYFFCCLRRSIQFMFSRKIITIFAVYKIITIFVVYKDHCNICCLQRSFLCLLSTKIITMFVAHLYSWPGAELWWTCPAQEPRQAIETFPSLLAGV